MAILIKGNGFEIPKACIECDLEIVDDEDCTTYCLLIYNGYTGKCREDGRLPDCPLVEVPDEPEASITLGSRRTKLFYKCSECGYPVDPGDKFCYNCGRRFINSRFDRKTSSYRGCCKSS